MLKTSRLIRPSLSLVPQVRLGPLAAFLAAALVPGLARGDDGTEEPAPVPAPAPATSDTVVISAPPPAAQPVTGVVNVNHVDNVIVAQRGSNVAVQESKSSSSDRYAPDPARKAAIIASPIFFGVGAGTAGIAWLALQGNEQCTDSYANGSYSSYCTHSNAVPALVIYDAIMTIVPSIPRWVVGDTNGALIYSALRGASVITASVVNWGTDSGSDWLGPFFLGFLAPTTLAIVDLATTPHREDLVQHDPPKGESNTGFQLVGIVPTTTSDALHHVNGGTLQLTATF